MSFADNGWHKWAAHGLFWAGKAIAWAPTGAHSCEKNSGLGISGLFKQNFLRVGRAFKNLMGDTSGGSKNLL